MCLWSSNRSRLLYTSEEWKTNILIDGVLPSEDRRRLPIPSVLPSPSQLKLSWKARERWGRKSSSSIILRQLINWLSLLPLPPPTLATLLESRIYLNPALNKPLFPETAWLSPTSIPPGFTETALWLWMEPALLAIKRLSAPEHIVSRQTTKLLQRHSKQQSSY